MRKLTHEQFLIRLRDVNIHYREKSFTVVSKYETSKRKIILKNKYGKCCVFPTSLLSGHNISIHGAVDKTSYFINQAREIHGDRYDYSLVDYVDTKSPVKVICLKHGIFEQAPVNHLRGSGCSKCGDEECSLAHIKNPVSHSYSNWKSRAKKSKNFDSFKVYIIRCWNDDEEFYKIGRTFTTIERRFGTTISMPYNYEIVDEYIGSAREVCNLEKRLHDKHKNLKYKPMKKFNGMTECFSVDQKDNIVNHIKSII